MTLKCCSQSLCGELGCPWQTPCDNAPAPSVPQVHPSDQECPVTGEPGVVPKVQSTAPSPDLSVAVKADNGKPRLSLIPPSASLALARVMTFGAKKYAAHNFRKGFDFSRLLDAAQRHMLAFQSGEDRDPETGEYHPAHAMFCMAALIEHMELGLGNDDRWKPPE